MARGTLSGLIWGSVIALVGVVVVSVIAPMPQPPSVVSADPAVSPPASTQAPEAAPQAPEAAQAAAEPEEAAPASLSAPKADSLDTMETADTQPAAAPAIGTAAPLAETTAPDADAPDITITAEDAPTTVTSVAAPQAPAASEQVTILTEPAQPAPPAVADDAPEPAAQADAPDTPAESDPAPEIVTRNTVEDDDTAPASDAAEDSAATQTPVADASTEAPADPSPATDAAEPEVIVDAGDGAAAPRIAALPRVSGSMTDDLDTETDVADTEAADTEAAAEEETTNSARIGQRAGTLTERDSGASSLPTTQVAAAVIAEPDAPAAPGIKPLAQFAAPFDNPDGKPLMSIVLLDNEGSIGAEALENFPYPLTFAIDPDDPRAAEKMARHRAAGFEVLALMDMPLSATAQDAETALEVGLGVLTEVVGVMEGTGEGIQGNRALSDQVTAVLRDQGYGFVTQNSGLNTVQKLAAREGVPSAFVFRDFDGAGQTPTVMRRFLDQAAFRAGQEGGVIMMGRVQPDTISALLLWGLQDRASRVALAPVSAVLTLTEASGG